MKDITTIYNKLLKEINIDKLKNISSEIIDGYKKKNYKKLFDYAKKIDIDVVKYKDKINKLFMLTIRFYHPDKLALIHNKIKDHYEKKEIENLKFYENLLIPIDEKPKLHFTEPVEVYEEYSYDKEDFGYYDDEQEEELDEESDITYYENGEYSEHEFGFIEAINRELLGNHKYTFTKHDLRNIEGDINLSDYDIRDLSGIENLINITSLNLSNNNISGIGGISGLYNLESLDLSENEIFNIDALKPLENLKDLDLSNNDIEDISILLQLPNLAYVNLIGNPIKNKKILDTLSQKNIITIF